MFAQIVENMLKISTEKYANVMDKGWHLVIKYV